MMTIAIVGLMTMFVVVKVAMMSLVAMLVIVVMVVIGVVVMTMVVVAVDSVVDVMPHVLRVILFRYVHLPAALPPLPTQW